MVQIFKVIRRLVKKLDLFSSIQLLRFQGDAETKTLTGGLISFVIFILMSVTFTSMIIETFHKVVITAISDTTHADEPAPLYLSSQNIASSFMLGVEVFGFDLNTGPRYFDVLLRNSYMQLAVVTNESVYYRMEPCTKLHWQYLPNVDKLYESVQMHKWLCMPINTSSVLKGDYQSDLQTTLDVVLMACNNDTDPSRPCAPQSEIDAYLWANSPLYLTPFFYNPLINPQSQNYLSTYLEAKYYTTFGPDFGSQMYIYMAEFNITTDESIMPFESEHSDSGPVLSFISKNSYNLGNSSSVYALISYFRAPETIFYKRNFQKAVDVLAYIGGLLGACVMVFIAINYYNQCSYEMNFAASLFKPEKNCPTKAAKFNLIYYLLSGIYNALRLIKIDCQSWTSIKFFTQTREEMLRQLDVKYLFKKLCVLQNAIMHLMTKSQLKGVMLQHKMTVTDAKKTRHIYTIKNRLKRYLKQKINNEQASEYIQRPSEMNLKLNISTEKLNQLPNKIESENIIKNNDGYNQTNYKEIHQESKPKPQQLLSDSQESSSESDGDEDRSQFQKIFDDLNQLRDQSNQNSVISGRILKNLDPFIKKIYESRIKIEHISFQENNRQVDVEQSLNNHEKREDTRKIKLKPILKNGNYVADLE